MSLQLLRHLTNPYARIMNFDLIIEHLGAALPNLLALYAFGSRIQDSANADSDLDLAVLVAG